ncbi:hypothetical protein SALBM217S_07412 [Streptomyces griseoloalbus]
MVDFVTPFRERTQQYLDDPETLDSLLAKGAGKARAVAAETLAQATSGSALPAKHARTGRVHRTGRGERAHGPRPYHRTALYITPTAPARSRVLVVRSRTGGRFGGHPDAHRSTTALHHHNDRRRRGDRNDRRVELGPGA